MDVLRLSDLGRRLRSTGPAPSTIETAKTELDSLQPLAAKLTYGSAEVTRVNDEDARLNDEVARRDEK